MLMKNGSAKPPIIPTGQYREYPPPPPLPRRVSFQLRGFVLRLPSMHEIVWINNDYMSQSGRREGHVDIVINMAKFSSSDTESGYFNKQPPDLHKGLQQELDQLYSHKI